MMKVKNKYLFAIFYTIFISIFTIYVLLDTKETY